ncbi:glycosyltransferase family 2 protein [Spirosoma spitsbergense]|uniref:glycosyltransferase family 2 protein n=1 Tax=Spirosoma spitsbergense TaxID=431554 RepID=UPI00036B6D5D|nr:glycosyltransferase family 2 protein [Spirosoma spitsbergense]
MSKDRSETWYTVPFKQSVPQITVIIATYNVEKYLDECLLSVLNQSYKDFEVIIIDGGSTDDTVNIIKQYKEKISYWISEPDQGIYDAWNKGLNKAKGNWISFVGADDQLHPDAFLMYTEHINQHLRKEELEFVSSRINIVNEDLSPICTVGEPWTWEGFQREMITWHVGTFHSKRLFDKYGMFDKNYKVSGDYELLLRPKDKLITSFVDQITAKMRSGGISSVNLIEASAETYDAKVKNGILSKNRGKILKFIDKFRLLVRNVTGWKKF